MSAIPTTEQIAHQIKTLREIKPRVRRTSAFGDNHHDAIDAQIEVLEKNMDEDAIYERWDDEDASNVRDAALDAWAWLNGEYEDAADLVASWADLMS